MASNATEVKVGDVRQGKGGLGVLIRVERIHGTDAECTLVRSGKPKTIKVSTLRTAYELKSRSEAP